LGVEVPAHVDGTLSEAEGKISEAQLTRLAPLGAMVPSGGDIANAAAAIQGARYASDVARDIQRVAILARRHLAGHEALKDTASVILSIELLCDHSVKAAAGSAATPNLDPSDLRATLEALAATGLAVTLLAVDAGGHLIRLTVDGHSPMAEREPDTIFSAEALARWSREHPRKYGHMDDEEQKSSPNGTDTSRILPRDLDHEVRQTLVGIGVGALPATRTVIVPDARLSGFPMNLLPVAGDFAGLNRSIAVAPSVSWLERAALVRSRLAGPSQCWVPAASTPGESPTLAVMAERLQPHLEQYGIPLDIHSELPNTLTGAELAIVGAHGGLRPVEGRYLRSISDEDNLVLLPQTLSAGLAGSKVVVLFVCSGGRLDVPHGEGVTVGLARRLLDEGCSAVLGCPWPMASNIPPHWLPAFLEAWELGFPVVDANLYANEAVARTLGDEAYRRHAMHLYGDPLVVKVT
jgi:hypothetical protein